MGANEMIALAQSWVGKKESDNSHRSIIDLYNTQRPLPRGYAVKYTDDWCATMVSALAVGCNHTDVVPTECSCPKMVEMYKAKGKWLDGKNQRPKPGDIIFYDWNNNNSADHVGIVESISGNSIVAIEGNYHNEVGRRKISVGYNYILGYGTPDYPNNNPVRTGWYEDSKGWYYLEKNKKKKNAWQRDSKEWCYLGADGYIIKNDWVKDGRDWYYLGADGRLLRNDWVKDSKDWCYVDSDGKLLTNAWVKDSRGWCFVINDGRLLRDGYANDGEKRYYVDKEGHRK